MTGFPERLHERIARLDTRVCLGIDPRPELHPSTHPENHGGDPARVARAVVTYFRSILEATQDLIACAKLQSAFFEAMGIPGLIAMAQLIADCRRLSVPAILDAKRGDIGSTARAYASAYLGEGVFGSDALTVNPLLGFDSLEPFIEAATTNGRGLFVLVKTSNPGSGDLQDLTLETGQSFYMELAKGLRSLAMRHLDESGFSPIGAVVGGTFPGALMKVRNLLPTSLLLVPGFGTQGADPSDIAAAFLQDGLGAVVNSGRSLTYLTEDIDYTDLAWQATHEMRSALNATIEGRSH